MFCIFFKLQIPHLFVSLSLRIIYGRNCVISPVEFPIGWLWPTASTCRSSTCFCGPWFSYNLVVVPRAWSESNFHFFMFFTEIFHRGCCSSFWRCTMHGFSLCISADFEPHCPQPLGVATWWYCSAPKSFYPSGEKPPSRVWVPSGAIHKRQRGWMLPFTHQFSR